MTQQLKSNSKIMKIMKIYDTHYYYDTLNSDRLVTVSR